MTMNNNEIKNEIKAIETVEEIIAESKRLQNKVRELLWQRDKMDELEVALKASIEYRESHPEVFAVEDDEEIEEEIDNEEDYEDNEDEYYDEDDYNDDYQGESEYDRNTDWREWNTRAYF